MYSLTFLNRQAISNLQLLVINNTKNWINDWCLFRVAPTIVITPCNGVAIENYSDINICKENPAHFFIVDHHSVNWEKLIFDKLRLARLQKTELKRLLDVAVQDLCESLLWPFHKEELRSFTFPKHIKTYIKIQISFGEAGSCEIICPHWVLPSPDKKSGEKLSKKIKRTSLINESIAELSLSLDAGYLPIADLKNMAVGTILKLEPAIANKFSLNIASKKIANVALGKIDTQKAFIILKE